ncbi:hypothetical protein BH11PAT4_BH11PAT4_2840 [soil metagenome]
MPEKTLEERIAAIESRNQKVALEKAWETSSVRRIGIVALTYVVMNLVLYAIGVRPTYVHAFVPTLGFFLSTLSIGYLKTWWVQQHTS